MWIVYEKVSDGDWRPFDIVLVSDSEVVLSSADAQNILLNYRGVNDIGNVGTLEVADNNDVKSSPLKYRVSDTEDAVVKRDYIIVKDGVTELADGAVVELTADGVATKTIDIQKRNGSTDADMIAAEDNETFDIEADTLTVLDKSSEQLVNGAGSFVVGPESRRGKVTITLKDQGGNITGRAIVIKYV